MKDRIPTKPGRIQLVPSPDDDDLFILTRADAPTQTGTPLNKASLLSDSTAQSLDLSQADPTVNDALASVASRYSMIRSGAADPDASTVAKKGDIYIKDDGGARRLCYICDADGEKPLDLKMYWERGSLNASGGNDDTKAYRVRCDVVHFPVGTVLSVASGFRFALYLFTSARAYSSTVSFRTSAYTFETAQYARVMIARTTEDTSESANVSTFSSKLSVKSTGRHWTPVGAVREVEKEIVITESGYFYPPVDAQGSFKIRAFGGGAGGYAGTGGYGGGGGKMAEWSGGLSKKRYEVKIGAGGAVGGNGGTTTFGGSLVTAQGGSGVNGGSGGGGGASGSTSGGSGTYGGGGGGHKGTGGNGGTYGGGGGGGFILASGSYTGTAGGSGKAGAYSGGTGWTASGLTSGHGGGGGGYAANGTAASSSANGNGGAGTNTNGFSLDFEGSGAAGTSAGGGGGWGGKGGSGSSGTSGAGGGGGGYGTGNGGNGGTAGGGGGGGWGGPGGNGNSTGGGGGGGYGLSGKGGNGGEPGGLAAGGGCNAPGGPGVVIITYKGLEVVR